MPGNVFQELIHALTLRDPRARRARARLGPTTPEQIETECERLLASDGEASSISLARSVFDMYVALPDAGCQRDFFTHLHQQFDPDRAGIESAYQAYQEAGDGGAVQRLFEACEPPRQELLRRLNLAPGGTQELVRMREDLLALLPEQPQLKLVDHDFKHLFGSWFNRGFLVLRRIDWDTSAAILAKLIEYEAVHEIRDWDDLRRRLDPRDRRCFAFFHPALGDEPLIFVEVALVESIPDSSQAVTHADHENYAPESARTAAFFGISNCQPGLQGISFGNFLLKQVVQELKQELPNLETFVTLSPAPGTSRWLQQLRGGDIDGPEVTEEQAVELAALEQSDWHTSGTEEERKRLRDTLLPLAAWYLTEAKNKAGLPLNPVARFHLRNGARMEHIKWLGDTSANNLRNGAGLMVNYVYDVDQIESNHERLTSQGTVAASREVRRLVRQAEEHSQGVRS